MRPGTRVLSWTRWNPDRGAGIPNASPVNVPSSVLSATYAAEARLSIELGPGIGPSASMSVLT